MRDAKPDDFDFVLSGRIEIAKAENYVIPSMADERKRVRRAIAERRVRVAAGDDGRRLGFMWFIRNSVTPFGLDYGEFGEDYYWVDYVFVVKGARGKGVGSALYADLVARARKHGVKKIMCDVFSVNKSSGTFHRKLGFKPMLEIYCKEIPG